MTTADIPASRRDWQIFEHELPHFADRDIVPSVSQLITWEFGAPPDIPPVQIGIDRGKKTHHCLQLVDEGDLDEASVQGHQELLAYMAQWRAFLRPGDKFIGIERPLWGTLVDINFIVRPDRIIERQGKVLVVDIKTKSKVGKPPDAKEQQKHGIEVAAQKLAVIQRLGLEVTWVGCLYIWPHKSQSIGYTAGRHLDQLADILGRWGDMRITAQAQGA